MTDVEGAAERKETLFQVDELAQDVDDNSQKIIEPFATSGSEPPSIRRVWFTDFKGFQRFEVSLSKFNVLVGANNSGKSTLLQGINLVFSLLKLHSFTDTLSNAGKVVPPGILPVASIRDLFFDGKIRKGNILVEAIVGIEFADNSMVEFGIRSAFGNVNSRVLRQDGMSGERLGALLARPAVWVPSAVGIVRDEEYRTSARRTGLITDGRHNEVLRNLILQLKRDRDGEFKLLQKILSERFGANLRRVTFNEAIDQFVQVEYESSKGAHHDLYSAGSGFVQIVQLLAFILTRNPSVVLLDEPDAHLHSSLQRVIIEILEETAGDRNFQILLATHSKEIINFVDPTRLIVIEPGTQKAAPASFEIAPITALRSVGAIDNVDAYALIKNRRCLFVEGVTDVSILGRFAATLGEHVLTGDDRVITIPVGGSDQFEHVAQLDVVEALFQSRISSLELRDRDGRLDEYKAKLISKSKRPLYVYEVDCIESFLLNHEVIARVVVSVAADRGLGGVEVQATDILDIMMDCSQEMRDDTVDRVAERLMKDEWQFQSERMAVTNANKRAREHVDAHWSSIDERLKVVSGKRLLARVRSEIQRRWSISFGNERLTESFSVDEIPEEIVRCLTRIREIPNPQ